MKIVKQLFPSYFLKKSGYKSFYTKDINMIGDKAVVESLNKGMKSLFRGYSYRKDIQKAGYSRIDDIAQKYAMCEDEFIKQEAKKYLLRADVDDCDSTAKNFSEAEKLLDCVNMACNKYAIISKFYPEESWSYIFEKKLTNDRKKHKTVINGLKPEIRKIYTKLQEINYIMSPAEWKNLYERFRLDCIKDYICQNDTNNPVSEYLWNKFFITQVPLADSEGLKRINGKFGTKTFYDDIFTLTKSDMDYIEEEFDIWEKAGGEKVKYPKLLDITAFMGDFFFTHAVGAANKLRIWIKTPSNIGSLRHEMAHLNDMNNSEELISIPDKNKQEMKNAGISDGLINYAGKNLAEYKAVFTEGNMDAYSDDFKKEMIQKGLPEFVTRLESHDKYRFNLLKEAFAEEDEQKTLKRLYDAFEGDIPKSVVDKLLDNTKYIEVVDEILNKQESPKSQVMDFLFELDSCLFRKIREEWKENLEKFNKILENLKSSD